MKELESLDAAFVIDTFLLLLIGKDIRRCVSRPRNCGPSNEQHKRQR